MWRKNRSPNHGSECIGTDLNRNYDQMWGSKYVGLLTSNNCLIQLASSYVQRMNIRKQKQRRSEMETDVC